MTTILMGSALQLHGHREPVQYVNMYPSQLTSDSYGVQTKSTTIVWHNRVKDPKRIVYLQNFSRRYGCLARGRPRSSNWTINNPVALRCNPPEKSPCAPVGSTFCTLVPLCMPERFQLNWSAGLFNNWFRCGGEKSCVKGADPNPTDYEVEEYGEH